MRPTRPARPALIVPAAFVALTALTTLTVGTGTALAQDTQSATDAAGKPVGMAEGLDIEQTDGLIRYGDADAMWQTLSESDGMGDMAAERWPDIDAARFADIGAKEDLVALVAESYSIDEQDATREVDAWVMEAADGM